MFFSKKMSMPAAETFWNKFSAEEDNIIEGLSQNPMSIVEFVDSMLKPVFPYFKKELEFELGFNDGVGEFFFYHLDNKNLARDGQTLKDMMPDNLKKRWQFIIES